MLNCVNSYKLFKTAVVSANGYSVVAERGRFNKFSIFCKRYTDLHKKFDSL
jgi:hypothetical protein